ncbi:leucine-rich repeat protein [Bacteroidales bacterium OttesenSCG-928-I14]|nr:leucine-rich repeat protein [Bacteroidales bacterium OttesenSCG-928-I14]
MKTTSTILTIILLIISTAAFAQREQIGTSNTFWELSINGSDTTLIISGTGDMPDFVNVKDAPWYSVKDGLDYLQIGNSITRIGKNAFFYCSGLTSVTIPNSVTSIGELAFNWCTRLASVIIPNSVTSLGEGVFSLTGLTSISIPNSITNIPNSAFGFCAELTTITLPASVASIGEQAFAYCTGLREVVNQRPTPITINANVFSGVSISACSLKVPLASVSLYKGAAVWQDFNIVGGYVVDAVVNNPAGGSVTGGGIYTSTAVLTATPEDGYIFRCWSSNGVEISTANPLSLTLANDTTVMAHFAQQIETSSTWWELIINESDTTLKITGTGAMPDFYWGAAPWHSIRMTLRYLEIGDNITHIGDNSFYGCFGLTSVTIPNSVTSIGVGVFSSCISLTAIIADAANPNYSSLDGVLYNKDKTSLIQYPEGKPDASFTIPTSVANIGDWAFSICLNLTSVTISNSVTDIGVGAFCDCSGLTSVTIGNSVTSIGERAFQDCSSLTSVTIPNSVIDIGTHAFMDCSNLSSVTIGNSVTSIGYSTFSGCTGLTSVIIGNSVTSIGKSAFNTCSSLPSVIIPNSVTNIEFGAFRGCSGLTSVTIGNSVTNIGGYAFLECTSLTSVTIPNSVTNIGSSAFYGCTSLTSVSIGNSVTDIGESAFEKCTSLTSVTIGNSVTNIGESAFYNCSNLTEIINLNPEPLAIAANVFTGVDKPACTLKVAISSVNKYEAAAVWQDFNIVGEGYIVSASVNNAAYGSVSGEGLYPANSTHSVTATANEGYVFTNWTVSGIVISTENTYSFTVTQDIELKANFTPALSKLTVSEGTLTPEFHQDILNYSVNIENNVNSITITAEVTDPDALLVGDGTYTLNTGDNTFTIVVLAQDKTSSLTYTVKVSRGSVGLDEWRMDSGELRVFPNPTKGELRIESGERRMENVEVFDINGKQLSTFNFQQSTQEIDISHLPNGIYFIKIKTDEGEISRKVVKN